MKKDCCNIKVTETENGYNLEITGDDIKEKCKSILENCCSGDKKKDSGRSCC